MNNKYDRNSFLAYINNPMSKESVTVLFASNNIKFEKCELYSDFVQSLFMVVFDTYLGDEVTDLESQFNHFKWCWDKNINNFEKEGLFFENEKLYNYFLEFMLEVFYSYKEKKPFDYTDKGILRIWLDIFDFTKTKTNSDVDTLIEIYSIFEKSLKLEKK
jgi:hypothetical protein